MSKILLTVDFNQGRISIMHVTNDTNIVPTSDNMFYLSSDSPHVPGEETFLVFNSEKFNDRSELVTVK